MFSSLNNSTQEITNIFNCGFFRYRCNFIINSQYVIKSYTFHKSLPFYDVQHNSYNRLVYSLATNFSKHSAEEINIFNRFCDTTILAKIFPQRHVFPWFSTKVIKNISRKEKEMNIKTTIMVPPQNIIKALADYFNTKDASIMSVWVITAVPILNIIRW